MAAKNLSLTCNDNGQGPDEPALGVPVSLSSVDGPVVPLGAVDADANFHAEGDFVVPDTVSPGKAELSVGDFASVAVVVTRHTATALEEESKIAFVDLPTYSSIDQLAEGAELVVEGTFGSKAEEAFEGALNGADTPGLDLELWEFELDRVIAGNLDRSAIRVSQVATWVQGGARPAEEGRRAILFLKVYPTGDFAIVGLGVGTLYVGADGQVTTVPEADAQLATIVRTLSEQQLLDAIQFSFS